MKLAKYIDAFRHLGAPQFLHYALQRLRDRFTPSDGITVLSRYSSVPLWCRHGTSDIDVFGQIFVQREYRCLDSVNSARVIVDCGANVGFSTAYFLSRYPDAHVIAVEPDPGNFSALKRNVESFGSRVTCLQAAVWSRDAGLVLSKLDNGDGREWSVAVREALNGEQPSVQAIDISRLIGEDVVVDVLKVDIEGAEREVFSGDTNWLSRVKNIVIELHGPECKAVFLAAVSGRGYMMATCDELHVCLAPPPGET